MDQQYLDEDDLPSENSGSKDNLNIVTQEYPLENINDEKNITQNSAQAQDEDAKDPISSNNNTKPERKTRFNIPVIEVEEKDDEDEDESMTISTKKHIHDHIGFLTVDNNDEDSQNNLIKKSSIFTSVFSLNKIENDDVAEKWPNPFLKKWFVTKLNTDCDDLSEEDENEECGEGCKKYCDYFRISKEEKIRRKNEEKKLFEGKGRLEYAREQNELIHDSLTLVKEYSKYQDHLVKKYEKQSKMTFSQDEFENNEDKIQYDNKYLLYAANEIYENSEKQKDLAEMQMEISMNTLLSNEQFHNSMGYRLILYIMFFFYIVFSIALIIFFYMLFTIVVLATFRYLVFTWITILGKTWLHMIFTVFGILSDFGNMFILLSIIFSFVSKFVDLIVALFSRKSYLRIKSLVYSIYRHRNGTHINNYSKLKSFPDHCYVCSKECITPNDKVCGFFNCEEKHYNGGKCICYSRKSSFLDSFSEFLNTKIGVSVQYFIVILLVILIVVIDLLNMIPETHHLGAYLITSFVVVFIFVSSFIAILTSNRSTDIEEQGFVESFFYSVIGLPFLTYHFLFQGLCNKRGKLCVNNWYLAYSVPITVFIVMSELYLCSMAYIDFYSHYVTLPTSIVLMCVRIILIIPAIGINICDQLCCSASDYLLKLKKKQIIRNILVVFYVLCAILCITIFFISRFMSYDSTPLLNYVDQKDMEFPKSYLLPNDYTPNGLCNITSQINVGFQTDDLAMLLTLPRLYRINFTGNNRGCYIIPNQRGVFNATMKYIFGEDYEQQGIQIYCDPYHHMPYLILTSQKIYEETLTHYNQSLITKFKDNIVEYTSNDYFDVNHLCEDGRAYEQCEVLKNCISNNYGDNSCKEEWENYTNNYWITFESNRYIEIPGLEQYQIQIDHDYIFEPAFNDSTGKNHSAMHFIIGGGFEDQFGYGQLIESFMETLIPDIVENFIPFYSYFRDIFDDSFSIIQNNAMNLYYAQYLSTNETYALFNLSKQFNFDTSSSVFMVGQSVSATVMNEFSHVSGIPMLLFEPGISSGYMRYRFVHDFSDEDLIKINQKHIIYSKSSFFTGYDESAISCNALPDYLFNPSVLDSACLTSLTCSRTQKYLPFCQQVKNINLLSNSSLMDDFFNAFYEYVPFQ